MADPVKIEIFRRFIYNDMVKRYFTLSLDTAPFRKDIP